MGPTGNRTWTISSARAMGAWMTALRPGLERTGPLIEWRG